MLPQSIAPRFVVLLAGGVTALFIGGYILQVASPLRLNTDAVRLLHMAEVKQRTGVFPPEQFPPLYPTVLATLGSYGLDHRVWLVGVNYASLAGTCLIAAAAAYRTIRQTWIGLLVVATILGSWVTIKHALIPLTDPLFTLLATSAVLLGEAARKNPAKLRRNFQWVAAFLLGFMAMQTRTVGAAVLVALVFGFVSPGAVAAWRNFRDPPSSRVGVRRMGLVVGVCVLGSIAAVTIQQQLSRPGSYLLNGLQYFERTGVNGFVAVMNFRGREFAQLAANLPLSRMPAAVVPWLPLVGGAIGLALLRVLYQQAANRPIIVGYLLTYTVILAVWPYEDPRFWLPVIPMVILLAVTSPLPGSMILRRLATTAWLLYLSIGLIALVMNVRLSFQTHTFPRSYTHGTLRASYLEAFGLPPERDAPLPDALAVNILRRHEPLAGLIPR